MFKKVKKFLVFLLLLTFCTQTIGTTAVYATASSMNSNDLGTEMIKIQRNKTKIGDVNTSKIDADSLRIIALFLSNYYVSMSTVLDGKKDSDTLKKLNDSMVSSLEDAGFDKSTAKALIKAVEQKSLGTAKPLVTDISNAEGIMALVSAFNMLESSTMNGDTLGTGSADKLLELLRKSPDGAKTVANGYTRVSYGLLLGLMSQKTEANLYYTSDYDSTPNSTPAFKTDRVGVASYALQNGSIDYSSGVGSSFYLRDETSLKDWKAGDEESIRASLAMTAQLYVDWVGNILMDTGSERVVILPACNNPSAFKVLGGSSGDRLNLVSFAGIYRLLNGDIYRYKPDDKNDSEYDLPYHNSHYALQVSNLETSLLKKKHWTVARGSDKTKIDKSAGKGFGDYQPIVNMWNKLGFEKIINWSASNSISFPNLSSWERTDKGLTAGESKSILELRESTGSSYGKSIMAFSDVIVLDNLGALDTGLKDAVATNNIANGWGDVNGSMNTKSRSKIEPLFKAGGNIFANANKNFGDMITSTASPDVVNAVYATYVYAYLNYKSGNTVFSKDSNKIDMAFEGGNFPKVADNKIDWNSFIDEKDASKEMDIEMRSMIYYLIHPFKGGKYVSVWIKNKVSAILLGWHEDMVGSTQSNTATGMTRYLGFTGYTTLPNLSDLSWTSWLLDNYNSIIVYLIILVSIILCCYVIVGNITGQRAIIGAVMFGFLAFLPPVAINTTVNIVNTVSDTVYGSKFSYWALVQHQSYLQELYTATTGTSDDYLDFVLKAQVIGNGDEQSANGYSTVRLKWLSPKKDNYLVQYSDNVKKQSEGLDNSIAVSNLFNGFANNVVSGQEFMESPNALYLYRDYMDVTMYALKSYNLYSTYNSGGIVNPSTGDYRLQVGSHWVGNNSIKNMQYDSGFPLQKMVLANYEADTTYAEPGVKDKDLGKLSSLGHIRNGFMYNTFTNKQEIDGKTNYYHGTTNAVNYLLNFTSTYNYIVDAQKKLDKDLNEDKVSIGKDKLITYGIPQSYFNMTMNKLSSANNGTYNNTQVDNFYFGLYSESPYYFLTYNILDQIISANVGYQFQLNKNNEVSLGKEGGFKDLLLSTNLDYFFNYSDNAGDGYGELRDFMNMHDLFYYVVPMMKDGNDLVHTFDKIYGMKVYDDVRVTFTADGHVTATDGGKTYELKDIYAVDGANISSTSNNAITYKELVKDWSDEKIYKFWHNYNTITMYNAYSRWVDALYDCDFADKERINVAGKKFLVTNPLDPTSYFKMDDKGNITEGRPMIFSESEKKYYGLTDSDLTVVEKKILDVQRSVYNKSIDLMNYYNFDDDVLVSALAMLELFEFNKEFSQTSLLSEDFIQYPQSYELKAFTYDAYLRLILSNTSGDSLQSNEQVSYGDLQMETNKSLYQRVMENTSITFGISLIVLDVLAVYVIPAFKVFFLIILFIMSILLILAGALKIENLLNVVWTSLISPLLQFSAVSIGMALVVSLFMYSGNKGVTGHTIPTIQLGDPTMVTLFMIGLNGFVVYLYFKICWYTIKDFKKFIKAIWTNIWGTVAGAIKLGVGAVIAGKVYKKLKGVQTENSIASHDVQQSGKENMPRPKSRSIGTATAIAGAGLIANSLHGHKDTQDSEKSAKKRREYDAKMESGRLKSEDKYSMRSESAYEDSKAYTDRASERRLLREKAIREGGRVNKAVAKYQEAMANVDDRMAKRREKQGDKDLSKYVKRDDYRRAGKARYEQAMASVRTSKVGTGVRQFRENTSTSAKPNSYKVTKQAVKRNHMTLKSRKRR